MREEARESEREKGRKSEREGENGRAHDNLINLAVPNAHPHSHFLSPSLSCFLCSPSLLPFVSVLTRTTRVQHRRGYIDITNSHLKGQVGVKGHQGGYYSSLSVFAPPYSLTPFSLLLSRTLLFLYLPSIGYHVRIL